MGKIWCDIARKFWDNFEIKQNVGRLFYFKVNFFVAFVLDLENIVIPSIEANDWKVQLFWFND